MTSYDTDLLVVAAAPADSPRHCTHARVDFR